MHESDRLHLDAFPCHRRHRLTCAAERSSRRSNLAPFNNHAFAMPSSGGPAHPRKLPQWLGVRAREPACFALDDRCCAEQVRGSGDQRGLCRRPLWTPRDFLPSAVAIEDKRIGVRRPVPVHERASAQRHRDFVPVTRRRAPAPPRRGESGQGFGGTPGGWPQKPPIARAFGACGATAVIEGETQLLLSAKSEPLRQLPGVSRPARRGHCIPQLVTSTVRRALCPAEPSHHPSPQEATGCSRSSAARNG
jgi:hypothetical protein